MQDGLQNGLYSDTTITSEQVSAAQDALLRYAPIFTSMYEESIAHLEDTQINDPEKIFGILLGSIQATDENAEHLLQQARRAGMKSACTARCSYCCFQSMDVTTTEVLLIAEVVKQTLPADRMQTITETAARIRNMSREERYARKIPCPLLANRQCSVYAHRPQACRSHHSVSRTACERDFRNQGRPSAKSKGIPFLGEPKYISQIAAFGRDLAFIDKGIPVERVELTMALDIALRIPDATDRHFAGEDLFSAARTRPDESYANFLSSMAFMARSHRSAGQFASLDTALKPYFSM